MTADEIAERLRPIIGLAHLHVPRGRRHLYLRALDLWTTYPKLGFVNALTAAMVEGTDVKLATFDSDFNALQGIDRWSP
jgi:hypothetical protein